MTHSANTVVIPFVNLNLVCLLSEHFLNLTIRQTHRRYTPSYMGALAPLYVSRWTILINVWLLPSSTCSCNFCIWSTHRIYRGPWVNQIGSQLSVQARYSLLSHTTCPLPCSDVVYLHRRTPFQLVFIWHPKPIGNGLEEKSDLHG